MKNYLLFSFLIISTSILYSQPQAIINKNPVPVNNKWGNDFVVIDHEPLGKFSGVQSSNSTIYVAVNDTIVYPAAGLTILFSTDLGHSWAVYGGVTYKGYYEEVKLVRTGLDSVILFFQIGDHVYSWPFLSGTGLNEVFNGNYRSFDVVASSTGNLYIFLDSLTTNNIIRYGSTNNGATWMARGNVCGTCALPKAAISVTGDTIIFNYYSTPFTDTVSSAIRAARYRESGQGTLASINFQDVAPAGTPRYEYMPAITNGEVVFVYTEGTAGNRNIYFRKSLNNGTTYQPAMPLLENADRDDFWFDVKAYITGFDFICYSDSVSAVSTPESDKLGYFFNTHSSFNWSTNENPVNEFPLQWSVNYSPEIIELFFTINEVGALFVAETGSGKKLFWDHLLNVIPVELTAFNAVYNDNRVILTWSTASEKNNKGFEVQVKGTSAQWNTIGFVQGKGTTAENNNYEFIINEAAAGKYSYRLKQIDLDGTSHYSEIVYLIIEAPKSYSLLQNFPNPFNPVTEITFELPVEAKVELKIFNLIGQEVQSLVNQNLTAGRHSFTFNAEGYSAGVYLYQMNAQGADGSAYLNSRKMIILK